MDNVPQYIETMYKEFAKKDMQHVFLTNGRLFFATFMHEFSDVVKTNNTLQDTSMRDNLEMYLVLTTEESEAKLCAIDYRKVPIYIQIENKKINRAIRIFLTPTNDGKMFCGYYSNYKAEAYDRNFNNAAISNIESFFETKYAQSATFLFNCYRFLNNQNDHEQLDFNISYYH